MYGVGDARCAVVKPREGRVPAGLVPCDQDDPGAHFCECYRGDLANSGRAARDDNPNSGNSPPQRPSTILIGDTPMPGEAMLPRNRVRTSWKGTRPVSYTHLRAHET